MPDKDYVIVADAATQTGYSREYIRRLARQEIIDSQKVGIVVLVHLPQLLKHRRDQDAVRAAYKDGEYGRSKGKDQ